MNAAPVTSGGRTDAAIATDGYAVIDGFCTHRELAALTAAIDDVVHWRLSAARACRPPPLLWLRLTADEAAGIDPDVSRRARRSAAAALAIDESAIDVGVRLFLKAARTGPAVPWHQDEAYVDPRVDQPQVNVWVPLTDVDERSGCLRVVPGSHRGGLLAHVATGDELGLTLAVADPFDSISLPIAATAATLHDRRTIHASWPNRTARPRAAVVFVCRGPATPCDPPRPAPWQPALATTRVSNLARPR